MIHISNAKRLLAIIEILEEYTDDEHALSISLNGFSKKSSEKQIILRGHFDEYY